MKIEDFHRPDRNEFLGNDTNISMPATNGHRKSQRTTKQVEAVTTERELRRSPS